MRQAIRALSTTRSARAPGPLTKYGQLVTKGKLRRDAAQVAVLEHLGRLHRVLAREREARDADHTARVVWATADTPSKPAVEIGGTGPECVIDPRAVGRKDELRKRRGTTGSEALDKVLNKKKDGKYVERADRVPKGLYVHGAVGRGKSLCTDMFFEGLRGFTKRRVHFHQFMLEVHRRLHETRVQCKRDGTRPPSTRDALAKLGEELAREAEVLVFDEMQITDVADAMVARTLFDACWDSGLVLVATSNRLPEDLYEGGPNRQYFSPFISRLRAQCRVVCLDGEADHRRLRLPQDSEETPAVRYIVQHLGEAHALASAATQLIAASVKTLGAVRAEALALPHNRSVTPDICLATWASRSSLAQNAVEGAVFSFQALCGTDRGAADFHAICRAYPALAIADVPSFSLQDHDAARRFITLVDECYERRTLLVIVARRGPDALFPSESTFERQRLAEKTGGLDRAAGPVARPSTVDGPGQRSSLERAQPSTSTRWEVPKIDPVDDEAFAALDLVSVRELAWAFKRCASRLAEMASPDWPRCLNADSASA